MVHTRSRNKCLVYMTEREREQTTQTNVNKEITHNNPKQRTFFLFGNTDQIEYFKCTWNSTLLNIFLCLNKMLLGDVHKFCFE